MNEEEVELEPSSKKPRVDLLDTSSQDSETKCEVTTNLDFNNDERNSKGFNFNDSKYDDLVTAEEVEQLKEFKVLDEVSANDENSENEESDEESEGVPEDEIEKMLEENLPENFKGAPKPKQKPYVTCQKIILEEKGINQFEVLPLDWVCVRHCSGMPLYLHRPTRTATLSRPYSLGKGNTRRHEIPISAIPCLSYRKALEEEAKQKEIDKIIEEQIRTGSWKDTIANGNTTDNKTNEAMASELKDSKEINVNPELSENSTNKDDTLINDVETICDTNSKNVTYVDKPSVVPDTMETQSFTDNYNNVTNMDTDNFNEETIPNQNKVKCPFVKLNKNPEDNNLNVNENNFDFSCNFQLNSGSAENPFIDTHGNNSENSKDKVKLVSCNISNIEITDISIDNIEVNLEASTNKEENISISKNYTIEVDYNEMNRGDNEIYKGDNIDKEPKGDNTETVNMGDNDDKETVNMGDNRDKEAVNMGDNVDKEPVNTGDNTDKGEPPVARPIVLPGGIVMAPPRVENVSTSWKTQHLTPDQVNEYCKSLFKFKTVNVMHFVRWPERRKYARARKALQAPPLPRGTTLITLPTNAQGRGRRDWVMSTQGCSYLSVFHEYVQRALNHQPVYHFQQLENASSPYQATVEIGGMQYGVGRGASKRAAKAAAARASMAVLVPAMPEWSAARPDLAFFDSVSVMDPRVPELCAAACEPSPHAALRTCLTRNLGAADTHLHTQMKKLEHQKIELTMTVGKHTATVVCKNKKTAKQRAAQAILQALHPHVRSWGSLVRLYGSRSGAGGPARRQEARAVTDLQDHARHNQPNRAVLNKLRDEMRRLAQRDTQLAPLRTMLLNHLPTASSSDLNNVDL